MQRSGESRYKEGCIYSYSHGIMAYGCADKKTAGKTAEEEYESLIKYIWRNIYY